MCLLTVSYYADYVYNKDHTIISMVFVICLSSWNSTDDVGDKHWFQPQFSVFQHLSLRRLICHWRLPHRTRDNLKAFLSPGSKVFVKCRIQKKWLIGVADKLWLFDLCWENRFNGYREFRRGNVNRRIWRLGFPAKAGRKSRQIYEWHANGLWLENRWKLVSLMKLP